MAGPTNKFSALDHRQPFPSAEVNRTGPGWSLDQRVERADATSHFHVEPVELPPPEPLPVPPTEAEPRERLRDALDAQAIADTALASAMSAHARAERHRQSCVVAVASYSTIEDEAAEATADDLRGGEPRPLPRELVYRMGEEACGQLGLRSAEKALAKLTEELEAARGAADTAARAVRAAEAAVLGITAAQFAYRHLTLLAEAAAVVEVLHSYDKAVTGSGATLPGVVAAVLRQHGGDGFVRPSDTSQWKAAAERLRADPLGAEVVVDIAAAVERRIHAAALLNMPRIPVRTVTVHARYLGPLGSSEPRFEPSPPDPELAPVQDDGDLHLTDP
jgi:hypothetical protein